MRHVEVNPQDTGRSAAVVLKFAALDDPANRRIRAADAKLEIPLDTLLSEGAIKRRFHSLSIIGMDAGRMVD
jgi:hypothetical protein